MALKITSELNEHLQNQFSTKTVYRELHKHYADEKEELQFENLCFPRQMLEWCMVRRNWFLEQYKEVILSDEPLFSLFPTTSRVYVLRHSKEAFHSDCLQSTVKKWRGFCYDLGHYSWKSAGPIIFFMEDLTKET